LKIDQAAFATKYPQAKQLPSYSDFFEFETFRRDAVESGDCYIQDPSTALACQVLDPQPGEKILDACAAPGGKTGYIAQLMQNRGVIVACDRNPQRIKLLQENMARLAVTISRPCCCDWIRDEPNEIKSLAPFDRILVDAPCSNTGVMRRRVDVRWRLGPDDFKRMPEEQMSILRRVGPFLKENGMLIYSTCSLEPEENQQVAAQINKDFPDLSLRNETSVLPFRDHFDGAFTAAFMRR
jgi:16S rRNA (cytosine967-C5)-methyltransferase